MKHPAAILMLAAILCATASAQIRRPSSQNDDDDGIYSRTIIHPDETRTVSKQDINNKIREKQTLDKNGILLMRSIFQLSSSGKPVNGLVYDGRNRLLYRSEFTYDNASRLQEERVFAADGTPVRRLIYKPDRFGQVKPFALSFADGRGGYNQSANRSHSRSAENLESFSTSSPHAYRGGSGVASTPSAYRPPTKSASSSRKQKRERRFRIFRRK
jgi:hypothetical protein